MAGGGWWDTSPGLRSVFGAIVSAAQQGQTTAQVWATIRAAASGISEQTLGITLGRPATAEEIEAGAQNILTGISAADVSSARGAAGAFVQAHANLIATPLGQQIEGSAIARPPWATTVNQVGIQEQYRMRVYREITVHGFTDITRQEWASYQLQGPLTSAADALNQANTLFSQTQYNRNVDINQILDYSIEAI